MPLKMKIENYKRRDSTDSQSGGEGRRGSNATESALFASDKRRGSADKGDNSQRRNSATPEQARRNSNAGGGERQRERRNSTNEDTSETRQERNSVKIKEETPEMRKRAKLVEKILAKYKAENKIRVPLPAFDSFQTDLEFSLADGPPRVVARLERIMGSDVAKLLDKEWMSELHSGLENEEDKAWLKRMEARSNKEFERSRKMAINGLIEPGPGMESVYRHPLYRVNKLMKRLSKVNYDAVLNQSSKLPPITPIDPFINDDTGKIFKSYPGHEPRDVGDIPELSNSAYLLYKELNGGLTGSDFGLLSRYDSETEGEDEEDEGTSISATVSKSKSGVKVPKESSTIVIYNKDGEEEVIHEIDIDEEIENAILAVEKRYAESLQSLQRQFGIEDDPDLKIYEPFQSHLVETLDAAIILNEQHAVEDLYAMAEEVVGVYNREVVHAEEVCIQLNKKIDEYINQLSYNTKD